MVSALLVPSIQSSRSVLSITAIVFAPLMIRGERKRASLLSRYPGLPTGGHKGTSQCPLTPSPPLVGPPPSLVVFKRPFPHQSIAALANRQSSSMAAVVG